MSQNQRTRAPEIGSSRLSPLLIHSILESAPVNNAKEIDRSLTASSPGGRNVDSLRQLTQLRRIASTRNYTDSNKKPQPLQSWVFQFKSGSVLLFHTACRELRRTATV